MSQTMEKYFKWVHIQIWPQILKNYIYESKFKSVYEGVLHIFITLFFSPHNSTTKIPQKIIIKGNRSKHYNRIHTKKKKKFWYIDINFYFFLKNKLFLLLTKELYCSKRHVPLRCVSLFFKRYLFVNNIYY